MEAALLLAAMTEDSRHVFLDSMPSPLSLPFLTSFEGLMGYRQVTDAYLVALATHNRAVLLTFDTRIAAAAGTSGRVEILS
jgi:predicted nucleic acid-binding protein